MTKGTNAARARTSPGYHIQPVIRVWSESAARKHGVSAYFGLPTYQAGLAGTASTAHRNVPDVAMPGEYAAIYLNGQWGILNGTSWSAPTFAAMLSEVYEYCNASFTNPLAVPYYVFGADRAAFIDVTGGNNQFNGTSPFYSAHAGYDNVSGLGVPLGMPFAQTVCPNRVPVGRVRAPALSAATQHRSAQATEIDVEPRLRGLVDLGQRNPDVQTPIQLVLLPSDTLAGDEQAVVGVLRAAGFAITRTFSNHLVVDASGSTADVERLFSTRMHDVSQRGYGVRYAPVSRAIIPSSLAPYVAGLTLDDVVKMVRFSGA